MKVKIYSAVDRVNKVKRSSANRSSQNLHDDQVYNQELVMIDHFTKNAEAGTCIAKSAEETCDYSIYV